MGEGVDPGGSPSLISTNESDPFAGRGGPTGPSRKLARTRVNSRELALTLHSHCTHPALALHSPCTRPAQGGMYRMHPACAVCIPHVPNASRMYRLHASAACVQGECRVSAG